jgi:hypothetical protein
MGQIWIEMTRALSDSILIPASIEYYPIMINENLAKFKATYEEELSRKNISLGTN